MADLTKMIALAVDGSENALRSFDYLDLMYGPHHNIEVNIFYVLPSLHLTLTEDPTMDHETSEKLKAVKAKNIRMAERILVQAKTALIHKGSPEDRIKNVYLEKKMSVAQEICVWATRHFHGERVFHGEFCEKNVG
jgi:hypothetical protein